MGPKPKTRVRSPRGQGDKLRADLLEAASTILAETGDPAKVTVRGVAARVGVSPNAVYLHFADRATLLTDTVVERFAEFDSELASIYDGDGEPLDKLRAGHSAYMRFAARNPGVYRTMFGFQSLGVGDPELNGRLAAAALPTFEKLVAIVEACVEKGDLPGVDPVAFSRLLFACEHGWSDMAGTPRGAILPDPDDILDVLVSLSGPPKPKGARKQRKPRT